MSTSKKPAAKKPAAKKAPAKKAPAKKTAAKPPVTEVAPAAIPALPAPPDGYTWSINPTGNVTLVRTDEPIATTEPATTSNVEVSEPEVGAKTIRNLRSVPVHLRLKGDAEKLYRVQLERRGFNGDTAEVPFACTQDTTFVRSYQMGLFEIISRTEAQSVDYPRAGFQGRNVEIVSPDQTTVSHKSFETGAKGQISNAKDLLPQNRPNMVQQGIEEVSPKVINAPGSDRQITAELQPVRRVGNETNLMQGETGRAEHTPDSLVNKGVMPDLPQVSGVQRVSEF